VVKIELVGHEAASTHGRPDFFLDPTAGIWSDPRVLSAGTLLAPAHSIRESCS
jgi:hypothetical protein